MTWLAPPPAMQVSRHARATKRRINRRAWQQERSGGRRLAQERCMTCPEEDDYSEEDYYLWWSRRLAETSDSD